VTLTIGGNDALHALQSAGAARLADEMTRLQAEYRTLVREIRETLPSALLVLGTVYDPTDGTGLLLGHEHAGRLPIELLQQFNDTVREVSDTTEGAVLADIQRHFHGHGIANQVADGFYWWPGSIIEPGARGSSEIRRVFLQAIDSAVGTVSGASGVM
jgi:hypothetical protein